MKKATDAQNQKVQKMLVVTLKQPKSKNPLPLVITSTMTVKNFKKRVPMTKEMMKIEMMKKMEGMKVQELKAMYNKMEMMGKEEEEEKEEETKLTNLLLMSACICRCI